MARQQRSTRPGATVTKWVSKGDTSHHVSLDTGPLCTMSQPKDCVTWLYIHTEPFSRMFFTSTILRRAVCHSLKRACFRGITNELVIASHCVTGFSCATIMSLSPPGQRENVHSVLRRNTDCLDVFMKLQSVSIPATTRNIYLWARDELRRWRGTSQGQTGITLSSRPQQLHHAFNMNKLVNWGPIAPPGCDGGRGASQKPFIILQQILSEA